MLILSRVCAEFHNAAGRTVFTVTPANLLSFLEAPEEIQEDPLFRMLLRDGSLEAVRSVQERRQLEADPAAGTTAEGKKASPAVSGADDAPKAGAEPAAKPARKAAK